MLHLHGKGVVHRDMKPENIFMRDAEAACPNPTQSTPNPNRSSSFQDPLSCVVADMDMAIVYAETTRRSRRGHVGTPGYMAPEILQNKEYDFQAAYYILHRPPRVISSANLGLSHNVTVRLSGGRMVLGCDLLHDAWRGTPFPP